MSRDDLEREWFALTREEMPALAKERGWPVRFDHCFQRIPLDHAVAGPWREKIAAPAYRHATDEQLEQAIELGRQVVSGARDLAPMNLRSLEWRGKRKAGPAIRKDT